MHQIFITLMFNNYNETCHITAYNLIIMEVGRFFVRTNLTNRAKNLQWTFTIVPSATFACEMKDFRNLPVLGYEGPYLVYDRKWTNIRLFLHNLLSGNSS